MKNHKSIKILFIVSIALMLFGSLFANKIHGGNGDVKVTDINFVTEDGADLRAILYVPKKASSDNKIPAVVANHGYNNTAELQAINAIELARRGIVVISIDAYGHGQSTFPDENVDGGIVEDMGAYSALQYLSKLPYVDVDRVGMVGHSMGGTNIQHAAIRAFENHKTDDSIVVPHAILPTSNSFLVNEEETELLFADHPVNLGVVFGQFDEWADGMWGVSKGSEIKNSPLAIAAMGFDDIKYDTFYQVGVNQGIEKDEAISVADNKELRVMYVPAINHPTMHFSKDSSKSVIEFFDVTLLNGENVITSTNQIWYSKEVSTGLALVGFFLFIPTLGLILLNIPFFNSITRPEPESLTIIKNGKGIFIYVTLFIVSLIPAPFIYMWATGYPIAMKSSGRVVPTVFPPNDIFPMPTMNGLVIFNVLAGLISFIVLVVTYFTISKKQGATLSDIGVKVPFNVIGKALLLAVIVFSSAYAMLVAVDFWFLTDFRYYVYSVKTLTPAKFGMLLKYIPFFAVYFIISSLSFNMTTRIKGAKEWQNIVLIIIVSCGSLAVLYALDYISLYTTGIKMFLTVPYPSGMTSALAGVLLWGLLFILPIAAVYARIFFRRTGSIWVGGFINSFVVTFFAMSNTVVAAGLL